MELDHLEQPLPSPSTLDNTSQDSSCEYTCYIFDMESQHMPLGTQDIDLCFRRQTISFISHLLCRKHLDPLLSYLAINYLDRFLSVQRIQDGKPWIIKLVAVSCVSLAIKMSKTEPSVAHIQQEVGFVFDKETIRRMELLILGALKWRMRSITPLSFINFFAAFFKFQDAALRRALTNRATEIILKSQLETRILEFKPSIVAASAVLYASHELFPLQFPCLKKAISSCSYVDKINYNKCNKLMQEIVMDGYESVYDRAPDTTPVNVLDRRQWSSSSSNSNTVTDNVNDFVEIGECKRRKFGNYTCS